MTNLLNGSERAREQGFIYLDTGFLRMNAACFESARGLMKQALQEAQRDPGPEADRAVAFAEQALQLVDGADAIQAGRYADAARILSATSDESMPDPINQRSAFVLAQLLTEHPDADAWRQLKGRLEHLDTGDVRARRYLELHDLTDAVAPERIRRLREDLQGTLTARRRLELQILLAELLITTNRLTEGELLLHDVEDEAGRKLLSAADRGYYVQVCMLLETRKAGLGDEAAERRLSAYAAASWQIYDPQ